MNRMGARAAGLLLGYAADRLFGDPSRFHPVAGYGRTASALERYLYADNRVRGAVYVLLLVGGPVALAGMAQRAARNPVVLMSSTALTTWAVLGGRSLELEAAAVQRLLEAGDVDGARRRVKSLVGRDTADLPPGEVARAAIESVAENTTDAVVTTLVWGALAGMPGLIAHRAANTLDAMVGHHNPRYERFGWAAARFDDLLGIPGSRIGGLLTAFVGPDPREALAAWRRDAKRHPSPNAGVIEATFAGALGIQLGGTNTYYGHRVEHRALMGQGRRPAPTDVPRTNRLARRVGLAAALTAASSCFACAAMPRHHRRG